jgi:hypothetical protein
MVGEDGKAVSGVFPMTFSLYKKQKAKRPVWKEKIWVAVDEGGYVVQLGQKKGLPSGKLENLFIGISIKGIGEVLREPFHPAVITQTDTSGVKVPQIPKGGNVAPAATHKGAVNYADTAGFATEAGHAKNADRLNNLSLDEILQKLKEAQGGGVKIRIGSTRKYGAHLGGSGGTTDYNEQCPEGYVMIGIRGAYGLYLDSIQIICAPIEAR